MADDPGLTDLVQTSLPRSDVAPTAARYLALHDAATGGVEARQRYYARMVGDFYDLVTDFYEFGWGQSFHFAPRHRGESLAASLARHEFFLALRLGLRPGMHVLDVGCGVGGPMRAIARFSGARIVGINASAYQVRRGLEQTRAAGLEHLCAFRHGDFMEIPHDDGPYDAVYAIEATCHAPERARLFASLARVMRPGALFGSYEWCVTSRYDPGESRAPRDQGATSRPATRCPTWCPSTWCSTPSIEPGSRCWSTATWRPNATRRRRGTSPSPAAGRSPASGTRGPAAPPRTSPCARWRPCASRPAGRPRSAPS